VLLSKKSIKVEFNKNVKFCKSLTKEAIATSKAKPVWITGKPNSKREKKRALHGLDKKMPYSKRSLREEISIL